MKRRKLSTKAPFVLGKIFFRKTFSVFSGVRGRKMFSVEKYFPSPPPNLSLFWGKWFSLFTKKKSFSTKVKAKLPMGEKTSAVEKKVDQSTSAINDRVPHFKSILDNQIVKTIMKHKHWVILSIAFSLVLWWLTVASINPNNLGTPIGLNWKLWPWTERKSG